MINEEKVKIMTKLAMYEQGKGRKYLPVSRYYRSDYIGLALIKNFFLITIGYVLIVAAVAVYFGEYLLENIHKMNLVALGAYIIIGYLVVLIVDDVYTTGSTIETLAECLKESGAGEIYFVTLCIGQL